MKKEQTFKGHPCFCTYRTHQINMSVTGQDMDVMENLPAPLPALLSPVASIPINTDEQVQLSKLVSLKSVSSVGSLKCTSSMGSLAVATPLSAVPSLLARSASFGLDGEASPVDKVL